MCNFMERSTIVISTTLVSIMKDHVEELSNLARKVFTIDAGDEEVFVEGTSVGDRIDVDLLEFVCVRH